MNKRLIGSAAILALATFGAPAFAQTVVIENYAQACYSHARNMRGNAEAIRDCDAAIESPVVRTGTRIRSSVRASSPFDSPGEVVSRFELGISMAAALVNRGIVKFYAGDDAGALADFRTAAEAHPSLSEPYVNAVLVHARREDWASVIDAIDKAMTLDARNPARLYYRRGWAYEAIGDWEQAIDDYRRAVDLAPGWDLAKADFERLRKTARAQGS